MARLINQPLAAIAGVCLGLLFTFVGCTKTADNPVGASFGSGAQVHLAMSFSRSTAGVSLMKTGGTAFADSIRIDSIDVVIEKIHLHNAADSVNIGQMGGDGDGHGHGGDGHEDGIFNGGDSNDVTLNGPFIVHIRDTVSVDFASQSIPAGTYDDISFIIHRMHAGDDGFDSDDQRQVVIDPMDSSVVGSSVVIWGAAMKNGTWTPFVFHSDLELSVNIPGTFVVPQAISSVTLAFNFNVSLLFKDPVTGTFLDPTDTSFLNHVRINQAIRNAFGSGRCGNDRNHDGHPDD